MKCETCKFCAYIIEGKKTFITTHKDRKLEMKWFVNEGSFCKPDGMVINQVEQCSNYEKAANGSKIKPNK